MSARRGTASAAVVESGRQSSQSSQLESLIKTVRSGTPRAAHQALQALAGMGTAAEAPLVQLLIEARDELAIAGILNTLHAVRIADAASVQAVMRCLTHDKPLVRAAAAQCLLGSSPKLRSFLPQIRAITARERERHIQVTLEKLLDRYPANRA